MSLASAALHNTQIVLASRPHGAPTLENFQSQDVPLPTPAEGQLLLQTLYLSLDPYMRGRMNDGPSYAAPVALGGVMVGGTVSRVIASRHPDFQPGERVLSFNGWQSYALSDGQGLQRLPANLEPASLALGVLGMPGFTAYYGLLRIGAPQPGETVVVASATGTVGSVVGQLAKLQGARVVGIAGGPDKCRQAVETLGFDACIDHRGEDFPARLAAAVPQGIDVYFENVGGAVFDAVQPLINVGGRIPLCGLISQYNATEPAARQPGLMGWLLTRRIKLQGFIIGDHYGSDYAQFMRDMPGWVREGRIHVPETRLDGLAQAPQGLIDLLAGRHTGKLVVKVAD